MPYNFVPLNRDGTEVVRFIGTREHNTVFTITRLPDGPALFGPESARAWQIFDLTRLPLEMHDVLAIILLMPLGALVTTVFRTLVGLRTFGTFTPTLIALSFIFADWRTGVFVFVLVLGVGLVSRAALERLKLLMVPRLSVILTLVVFCLVFVVSLLDYLGLTPSAQAVLLPMVILTMTVERFYLTSEEDGVGFALKLMAGTVFLAFCCYLVLRWKAVGAFFFVYPEAHLFTIAVLVLAGRYTGYRLTELWRFGDAAPGP